MSTEGDEYKNPLEPGPTIEEAQHALARSPLRHIAFIMDGNGRWAQERGLKRTDGHRAGSQTVRMVVEECRRLGIRYLTLFAFSSENWSRPADEVGSLMELFSEYLREELPNMLKNGIRLRTIGDRSKLSESVRGALEQVENRTLAAASARRTDPPKSETILQQQRDPISVEEQNSCKNPSCSSDKPADSMDLILAISYGSRDEIVSACRNFAQDCLQGRSSPEKLTVEQFTDYLYAPDIPDPDLLIRTSDEFRISNFLLWQIAYSELLISRHLWPDFSRSELYRCIIEYSRRNRRFGLTAEQLEGAR